MSSTQENSVLSNIGAVVLALYELGGDQKLVDTEDIAMVSDRIAPGQFRWRKYPDQINLDTARVSLTDAAKKRLVSGGVQRGWSLTVSGVRWASANLPATSDPGRREPLDRQAKRRQHLERSRIVTLPASIKHLSGEPVSRREAESVFRVDDYSSLQRKVQSVERMKSLFTSDPEMHGFLEEMAGILMESDGEEL